MEAQEHTLLMKKLTLRAMGVAAFQKAKEALKRDRDWNVKKCKGWVVDRIPTEAFHLRDQYNVDVRLR